MKKTLTFSLLACAALTPLYAQHAITLAPLAITSTPLKSNELQATEAVEIYTAEDIKNAHAKDLYEFLNTQTSLIAMPSYGNPFTQKLDMRGYGIGDGYQNIVVTINGRRLNNIDMIPQLLSSVAPESIEKIEIIKSSGIVANGDGANAGVINITTKQTNDKEFAFFGGAYGAFGTSAYLGHREEQFALSAGLQTKKSDGIRTIDGEGNKDRNKLTNGTFALTYNPHESLEFRYGAMFSRSDVIYGSYLTQSEYDANPTQAGATNSGANRQRYATNALSAGVSYMPSQYLSLNLDANREKKKSEYVTYDSRADYLYDSAKLSLDFDDDTFALSLGADLFEGTRDSHATSYAPTNETTKENIALYLITRATFGAHAIKAGVRGEKVTYGYNDATTNLEDKHTLYGAELGYNYAFDKENSLFASYAHAYQAPDIDRFFTITYPAPTFTRTVLFNGFINPMKSDTLTLGYNNITPSNKLKISVYYIDLKDEIYLEPMSYVNTNIDASSKYGVDIYDKWILSEELNAVFNYNYVQATIDTEENYANNKLPGVSNHNAKATLSYMPNPRATLALTQIYRSKAYAVNDFANNFAQK
ncbi:MAG: TonB-dependent receptor, partial [Thiovulaceae bacterium]|nr:TonB-dependent receptor [Sulfurimonadaceae bacterium]